MDWRHNLYLDKARQFIFGSSFRLVFQRYSCWHIDKFMTKELVINAFRKASEDRQINDEILFHSDQGI